jgi:hypothetical protein
MPTCNIRPVVTALSLLLLLVVAVLLLLLLVALFVWCCRS